MIFNSEFKTHKGLVKFSFKLENGRPSFLVGENGIGKSSFFHFLKVENLKGSIFKDLKVSFLDQGQLKTLGNVSVISLFNFLKKEYWGQIRYKDLNEYPLINLFDFKEKLKSDINDLSGGENQILKILILFYLESDLYFLDEPTQHLDAKNKESFYQILGNKDFINNKKFLIIDHFKNMPQHINAKRIDFIEVLENSFVIRETKE